MAPSPTTIPTSFVPKQPVKPGTRFARTGGNVLLTLALVILAAALIASGGVFAYERYLIGVSEAKKAEVEQAQGSIDQATVENFVRTRDRFAAAKTVLDEHVAASRFFDLLESLTLKSVRFSGLTLTVADDRSAAIQMDGVAKTFNALAAESSTFAGEKRVKRAIFSGIKVNKDGSVSFSLSASLDPSLLAFVADGSAPAAGPATPPISASSTPASSTPASAPPASASTTAP